MKRTIMAAAVLAASVLLCSCSGDSKPAETEPVTEASVSETDAGMHLTTAGQNSDNGDEQNADASVSDVKCSDITAEIIAQVEMSSMAEVWADRLGIYLDCPVPDDSEFSMLICGSGGFADEIFVVKCGESADEYIASAEKRIESRKKDFEGYNPDEYDKLDNYYSEFCNGYYIYAVTPDNAKCEEIFASFVK